jgi:hypothetical protein
MYRLRQRRISRAVFPSAVRGGAGAGAGTAAHPGDGDGVDGAGGLFVRSQRNTHMTSAGRTRTCWFLSAGVRQCPCKTRLVMTELVTQLMPRSTLASCLGMDRKSACDDDSRTTWLAAAAIASWACGGMAWSCSQMM